MPELKKAPGRRLWQRDDVALAGIVLLGIILYAHTLHVPWYMDDLRTIVESQDIRQLGKTVGNLLAERGLANLTFALNYRFGGVEVVGYHAVNIAIHLATSCLVFLLLKRVFRENLLLAIGGALIFVAHPLQTQAVTYIVQRMTSLAGMFFFLALYLYVRFRETSAENRRWLFYGGALICGAFAVLVKQNTAVLPIALVLFDRYFLENERHLSWQHMAGYAAPFALAPVWLAAKGLFIPMLAGSALADVGGMPDLVHLKHLSPLNYLATEFYVIWLYLRLLIFPYGQALDYDVAIVANFWNWVSMVGLLGIILALAAAFLLRKRQPTVSAGIFWFFLALVVESTIIPLDPVFEHRLYIPIFGFVLVVMAGFANLPRRTALTAFALIIATLSILTWQRNNLWNDPVAFHEDNLRRAPRSERVRLDLGNAYRKQGRLTDAQRIYEEALGINPDYILLHINLSLVYSAQQNNQKAVEILLDGLRRNPAHFKLYNNIGVLYNVMGKYSEAAHYLQKGAMIEPDNAMLHFNLALAYSRLGRLDEAIVHYRRSIALDYDEPESHFNLGLVLYRHGKLQEALQEFLLGTRMNPKHAGTLYNAALIALELGNFQLARELGVRLQSLDQGRADDIARRISLSGQSPVR